MSVYENPSNGYRVSVGLMSNIAVFVFGIFFFMFKGYWRQFWITIFTLGFAWFWYLFFIQGSIKKYYLEKGWKAVA